MKVRIAYTIDADDTLRREINRWYGREGLATREQVRDWSEANGSSMNMDLSLQADDHAEVFA